jgi:predicted nucleic acid-binding protein
VIILNSSPVLHLTAGLGGLDVLPTLYSPVVVPAEVLRELESGATLDNAAVHVRRTAGIEIRSTRAGISPLLAGELDLGESAVIALALELPGATVVLGDLKARRVARRSGIPMTGSIGVLLHAKRLGKLASVAETIERIRARGAWLSDAVVACALELAGEQS